jgi:hypothetical protein
MGGTIDAIEDRVVPRRIIQRRRNRIRSSYWAARDAVMGRAGDVMDAASERSSHAGSSVSEGMSHLADRATDVPHQVTRQTQGSPLGAGLIAFGAGVVLAALLPPSEPEQQLASKVKDAAEPLVDDAKTMGKELASSLQSDGQQAVESVKETAQEAAGNVKDAASGAMQQTQQAGTHAVHEVRQS